MAQRDLVTGELFFGDEHQVGLTVGHYRDGLMIIHAQPASVRPRNGGGKAIITTYRLDEAGFEAVRGNWEGGMPRRPLSRPERNRGGLT